MDAPPAVGFSFQPSYEPTQAPDEDADKSAASKGPKRKRLAKACDACHKSKRRYFASKPCHYTDASGRPVAAPHTGKPDASKPPRSSVARSKTYSEDDQPRTSTSQDHVDGEPRQARKRVKNDRPNILQTQETSADSVLDRAAPLVLDPRSYARANQPLFTHCHPVRAVIHKPSFSASLSHNRVPSHLLFAICALAAPLSRQPHIRSMAPPRLSGKPFAHEALSQMFDGSGHLICDPDLFTAQALCLLMVHDLVAKDTDAPATSRYRDLALQVVQALGVLTSDHPVSAAIPTADSISASIERECVRRVFWVIHIMDLLQVSLHTQRPVSLSDTQLRLRLPVDETSFELAVHSTSPEYLYLPPVRQTWLSELGHFIRIFSLFAQTEQILNRPDTNLRTLADVEKRGEEWVSNLPDHLRFSEQNLQFEHRAWCFCCMHVYYAGFILALQACKNNLMSYSITSPAPVPQRPQWTVTRLDMIMGMLGDRAKNSMIMGAFIWIQIKYCNRDDAQIRALSNNYEEMWGTRIPDLVAAATAPRLERVSSHPFAIPLRVKADYAFWSLVANVSARPPRQQLVKRPASAAGPGISLHRDADSSSKNGGTSGRLGESLPSLKSSGLLDSWNSATASTTHSRTDMRELSVKPPPGMESDVRSTTLSGMPVGLQWLANESR
ncbi:hypothetical protein B0H14DRAFT_2690299 [Mycena olivaceomarginata]|nr:hypothetical protein B0H14DRAFT_2690299 [Mycena olivaceomarginata]